jgi:hypothetical protein
MKCGTLEKNLAEVEECIAEGKAYVEAQRAKVTKLTAAGQETAKAKGVLKSLQDTLAVFIDERDQLKSQLAKCKARR